ncbi:MAG: SpoIID/LytB domain-containing protein, partial [Bradymonadaceae bacterium]
ILAISPTAAAQQTELTTADRLAILYAPQLDFTEAGDPMIRVGLVEGRETIHFTPSKPIRVMPRGSEGAEVVLPADHRYTVRVSDSEPGGYEHWVVVDGLTMSQRERVDAVKKEWVKRNYQPRTFQVGGLFGIRGEVFDSRKIAVAVGGVEDHGEARKLRQKLEARHGINARIHSELTEHPSAQFELTGAGIDITVRHRDVMWIAARDGEAGEIRYEVPRVPKPRGEGTETLTFGGRLIVAPDRDGKIALINKIGAERLVKGVVPAETYASAPLGALRAQAVAARNNVFAAIGVRNLADPYMLRSDVYDQVYRGLEAETDRTSKAVESTRGQVMFHGGQIIDAKYSSNAGGFTESNENVWNAEPRPYLRGRPDAPMESVPEKFRDGIDEDELGAFLDEGFDAYSKDAPIGSTRLYRWEKTVEAAEALEWLDEHGREIERIQTADVTSRGKSGRAIRMKLVGADDQTTYVERELNIRRLFDNLRSGLFTMRVDRREDGTISTFHFKGAGFGHGVGMCQTGATGMAQAGKSYKDILTHYYKGIEIKSLY